MNRRGFTLLEVSVALMIVALLATAVAAALSVQARSARALVEERAAWEAAAGQLELLEANDEALRRGAGGVTIGPPSEKVDSLPHGKLSLTVSPGPDGTRRATARVEWTGINGPRSLELSSLLGAGP